MRRILLTTLGVCLGISIAGCGKPSEQPTATDDASVTTASTIRDMPPVCPVTGHHIEDVKTAPSSVYEGKRYYFQCPSCKAEFDRDPVKYTAGFEEKVEAAKRESDESHSSEASDKSEESEASEESGQSDISH